MKIALEPAVNSRWRIFAALGVFVFCFALPARAQPTLAQWLQEAPPHGYLQFTPWEAYKTEFYDSLVPQAPAQNLFGHLAIANVPASEYPLTLRYAYLPYRFEVEPRQSGQENISALQWGQRHGVLQDKNKMPAPAQLWSEQILNTESGRSVAVWSNRIDTGGRESPNQTFYALTAELLSRSGRPLERKLIIEAWVSGRIGQEPAIVLSDPEADRYFQTHGMAVVRAKYLTPDIRAYSGVRGLWVDQAALADPSLDTSFYRRLLLLGMRITGRAPAVAALEKRLAIRTTTAVLDGWMGQRDSEDKPSQDFENAGYYPRFSQSIDAPSIDDFKPISQNLSSALRKTTLYMLGSFILFESLLMTWGFLLWEPERRMRLWVLVPSGCALWAMAGLFILPQVMSLNPTEQITRCLYSYGDWPETLIQNSIESLGFNDKVFSWSMPPGTDLGSPEVSYDRANRYLLHTSMERNGEESRLTLTGQRGGILSVQTNQWAAGSAPCRWRSDKHLEILEDFEHAWLWDGLAWKDLGAVRRGEIRDVMAAPAVFKPAARKQGTEDDAEMEESPYVVASVLPQRIQELLGRTWQPASEMASQGIFIGWHAGAPEVQRLTPAKGLVMQSRTFRIHGFPLGRKAT